MAGGLHREPRDRRHASTPQTFLMTQIRNVVWKWHQESTVLIVTSRRTTIARCASEPKLQGLFAEGELVIRHLKQRNLVIWLQLITKSATKDVNLGTIIDTQSWYKILPLDGFSRTRAKQKLLRRRKEVYESFPSRLKSQKSFTQTILWILANPVKTYHGIIVLQRPIDPRRMALLKEQCEE